MAPSRDSLPRQVGNALIVLSLIPLLVAPAMFLSDALREMTASPASRHGRPRLSDATAPRALLGPPSAAALPSERAYPGLSAAQYAARHLRVRTREGGQRAGSTISKPASALFRHTTRGRGGLMLTRAPGRAGEQGESPRIAFPAAVAADV